MSTKICKGCATENMYAEQRGKCAICGCLQDILCVDHNHETNVVRGLLCGLCNTAIGMLKEDSTRFDKAKQYLAATDLAHQILTGTD